MNSFIYTVSQVNEYVRSLFSRDTILKNIYLRGEISNYKYHSSGHMYFSLKDDECLIRCVMFRQHNLGLGFTPRNGMEVIVKGYVSIYVRDGQYQFYSERMEQDGLGALHLAFEKMKSKLQQEGLFDEKYKISLPLLPYKIGIITSHTGAALKDIIHIAHRRFFNINLLVVPVLVQGEKAANEIAHAIDYLNTREDIDIIITGRGGGSIEELWAFNEECVARSIFRSKIPVVSAVGHETDYTIADFVADLRAPTPSAAAELCVPQKVALQYILQQLKHRIFASLDRTISNHKQYLQRMSESALQVHPLFRIHQNRQYLDQRTIALEKMILFFMEKEKNKLLYIQNQLKAFNPFNILKRGYIMLLDDKSGVVLKTVSETHVGQTVLLQFADGQACAIIKDINILSNGLEE